MKFININKNHSKMNLFAYIFIKSCSKNKINVWNLCSCYLLFNAFSGVQFKTIKKMYLPILKLVILIVL